MPITSRHLAAMNHLLHVQTKDAGKLRQSYQSFTFLLPSGLQYLFDLPDETRKLLHELPEFRSVVNSLLGLRDQTRQMRVRIAALHRRLEGMLKGVPHQEYTHLATGYIRAEDWARFFRQFASIVDESSADRAMSPVDANEDVWFELAEPVRDLIRLKDHRYQYRLALEHAMKRLPTKSKHGLRPTQSDREQARWDVFRQTTAPLDVLSKYLDSRNLDYTLQTDSLSRPSTLLNSHTRSGLPPSGLFADLFQPFIDYLCATSPNQCLAVCEQLACGAVFDRQVRPRSQYCSPPCEK